MAGLHDLIPGLREAERAHSETQLEAFAGMEPDIAGLVEVLPFTPQMFLELAGCGNGFFGGRDARVLPEDICQFLWRVSPKFSRSNHELRKQFIETVGACLTLEESVLGIVDYIGRAWAGMPSWSGSGGLSAGVWPARLVHMFAKEYGWEEQFILNLPYRRLWQYANRILEDHDPKYRERCRESMRLRDEWLQEQNAKGRN